jgi:hypothetical protein
MPLTGLLTDEGHAVAARAVADLEAFLHSHHATLAEMTAPLRDGSGVVTRLRLGPASPMLE